ncbi:hypothetical protein NC653_038895 [Populus alba x Populus x berolinensis]|uniref:NADP-dependent glyceraldehyde-3-phosphate dehydrogenase n=1 Tax=Populus alba x Populus x berolinensis TaxID=444605 RepID=A0AAD6LA58_9ROSI|nr:hypothetical protein NC653_038895 [Populus alba x Populus x berolinensis]
MAFDYCSVYNIKLLHKAAAILKEHRAPMLNVLSKRLRNRLKMQSLKYEEQTLEISGVLIAFLGMKGPNTASLQRMVSAIVYEGYCHDGIYVIMIKFSRFRIVPTSLAKPDMIAFFMTTRQIQIPLGVVLAIPPFNYPVNLAVSKIAPALIAGNSIVLKPPTQGAVAALHMVHCFHLAGFPKGLISCVTGKGSEIGDFLTMHPGVSCISFTGGDTGIAISKKAGMIPLQMELGGKDACIILEDGDLDLAAANIIKGGFSYSGQRCTAVKVILIMESVADTLVEKVKAKVAKLTVGPPEDDCDITPVVTESSANFIEGLVMDAKQKGATFCQEYKREGNLIWPLLLDNVRPDMRIAWEEPFGPVLPVIRINSIEEAIHHSNASNFGLQGCIFTRDINKAILISDAMETGTVQINSAPARGPDHFPFQGLKDSGIGSQGITNSINMMTKIKSTVINLPTPSYAMG